MSKKIIIFLIIIIIIVLAIFGIYKIVNNNEDNNSKKSNGIETIESDSEFKVYSLNNINIKDSNANLIFLDDINGEGQEELTVNVGSTYSFEKYGNHMIRVLEMTDDYIVISTDGLAPTKKSGGFSLQDKYNKVTIKKNSGIRLNVQATDLRNGSVYFFYVSK